VTPVEIAKAEHRELAYKQMLAIVHEAGVNAMKYLMEDPARYFTLVEAIGFIDMSLGIKFGVQMR
jgi:acyl-CoA oxidase